MSQIMISAYLGKISMYLKIGLLLVIIILLVTIGIQWTRIKDVERKNENLKIENKKALQQQLSNYIFKSPPSFPKDK